MVGRKIPLLLFRSPTKLRLKPIFFLPIFDFDYLGLPDLQICSIKTNHIGLYESMKLQHIAFFTK
jgi:hypothetical protein